MNRRLVGVAVALLVGLAPAAASAQQYPPQPGGGSVEAGGRAEVGDPDGPRAAVEAEASVEIDGTDADVDAGVDLDTEGIAAHREPVVGGIALAAVVAAGALSLGIGTSIVLRQRRSARTSAT